MSLAERVSKHLWEVHIAFPSYAVGIMKIRSIHVWKSFDSSLPESFASYNLPQEAYIRMMIWYFGWENWIVS